MPKHLLFLTLLIIILLAACSSAVVEETPAIVWERSGGIAGICQRLSIETTGAYTLMDCNENTVIREGQLSAEQWQDLSNLLGQYGEFTYQFVPPGGTADMFTDEYIFNGTGTGMPTQEQQEEINQRLASLATELGLGEETEETSDGNSGSGIVGQVLIGPTCPAQPASGPEATQCADQPYQATITILDQDNQAVTQLQTDASGSFQVSLPPGSYTLLPEPDPNSPLPRAEQQTVSVPEDEWVQVTVVYDSGIR